jgi:hypothetical protein
MQVDREHLRRHYDSLSDEELRQIRRSDLTEVAQEIYDAELERRGQGPVGRVPKRAAEASPVQAEADWLEEAAEAYSVFDQPGRHAEEHVANARSVLDAAGIPCHVEYSEVVPDERTAAPPPTHQWRLLVPAHLSLVASSTLERDIFNQEFEAMWQAHLEALSDDELVRMPPEAVFCGLYDRLERAAKAYEDELARRRLR